jgi:hypothetical protein
MDSVKIGDWIAVGVSIALVARVLLIDNPEATIIVAPALIGLCSSRGLAAETINPRNRSLPNRSNGPLLADRLGRSSLRPVARSHRPRRSLSPANPRIARLVSQPRAAMYAVVA